MRSYCRKVTTSQEIALRSGCPPEKIAAQLSNADLFQNIAGCERIGQLSWWRERFYQALLVERYVRPPVSVDDEPDDHEGFGFSAPVVPA